MREMKFRVWNSSHNEMVYCYDLYWFEKNGVREIGDDYILMQYIGLKDKERT